MARFCAVDPSISCTGIAILEYDKEEDRFTVVDKTNISTKLKYKDRFEKKIDMANMFEFYLKDKIDEISFFVFENYSYGSPGHLADLGEMNGLLKKYIHSHNKHIDVMAPSSVKKIVAGNGRASKDEVKDSLAKFIKNFERIKFITSDESDAVAIGVAYGIKMLEEVNRGNKED